MTYENSQSQTTDSAGIGVVGGGAWPRKNSDEAWSNLIRDVGVAPFLTGFFQGFATVAIANWREQRAARNEADSGLLVSKNATDELPTVFIGPK